jgi:hypothetical protein
MLRNYDKRHFGNIDFSTDAKAADAVLKFLDLHLCEFPKFLKALNLRSINEDVITSKLEIYLQRQARQTDEIFMFQFQCPETNSRRSTDMSVIYASPFSSTESLFVIEAKRLPTPGSGREREYVQGNLGAMERFKRGHHGQSLARSAIFGYVEAENYDHWHKAICSWINELIKGNTDTSIVWNTDDLLTFLKNVNGINLYNSLNARIGNTQIQLTHYWININ